MRIVFFGTPEFAVPTLAALVEAGEAPLLVISQPARPVGRGRKLRDPPVAAWAREHGLAVEQPEKVRGKAFLGGIRALEPDVAVVVAFGQIFRRRLLELPRLGCVNLHASLLPRYRGAAPIQAAIVAGETVTGVTTMVMERGLDSGPMLFQEEVAVGPEESTPELAARLAEVGAELMVRTLRRFAAGDIEPQPQNHELATVAPMIKKSDGIVDWRRPAGEIFNRLRAYTPWPGLVSELRGKPVKILRGRSAAPGEAVAPGVAPEPGAILGRAGGRMLVAAGDGTMFALERLQLPGKKPVSAVDFMNGARIESGERFGEDAGDDQ